MSLKGIFPTCKWHFFCSISLCALMVSLVNSFFMTGTPMLSVPFSMPSWRLFFSIILECITGMEISTPFCFLIALLTLNPNYKMNMFCYKKQREMMKLSKMVTLVFSSLFLFIIFRLQNYNHLSPDEDTHEPFITSEFWTLISNSFSPLQNCNSGWLSYYLLLYYILVLPVRPSS